MGDGNRKCFFFVPAMLLAVGFLHGELTSLLWGGAFGFLWAYVFVARLISSLAREVKTPQGTLEVVSGASLLFRKNSRVAAPAFFGWWLCVEGEHSVGRRFSRKVPLDPEVTTVGLQLLRGRYQVTAHWELNDVFGFSRLIPKTRWQAVVTIVPAPRPFVAPPPPPTRPGPWRPRRSGRRTGDPFDVRPYNPGDDLRRLHWPLFAHSDTPFVRTAEPSPPPAGHQFLVLDTEASSEEDLDFRLEGLVAWLQTLDEQGTGWTLVVPAVDLTLSPGAVVGTALAPLVPTLLPDRPLDGHWPDVVTVLTGTENMGAGRLAKRLAASRRRYHPIVVESPTTVASPRAPWWRHR